MPIALRSLRNLLWCVLLAAGAGCGGAGEAPSSDAAGEDRSFDMANVKLAPVHGRVTVDHKSLAMAVVTFMPSRGGLICVGETDEDGKYEIENFDHRAGAPPGTYKVSVSYLIGKEGLPIRKDHRIEAFKSAQMASASEVVPREYSDLGRTKLSAVVTPEGGQFDFDLTGFEIPAPKNGDAKVEPEGTAKPSGTEPAAKGDAAGQSQGTKEPAPSRPGSKNDGTPP